jgi:hypothetical protein
MDIKFGTEDGRKMAAHPENFNAFDFGPIKTYPAEAVAEKIVWPLVDELWRGDWRVESNDGDEFQFPKSGKHNGRILDVRLDADCNGGIDEDGEPFDVVRSATVYIEQHTRPASRSFLLAAAKKAAQELQNMAKDIEGLEEYAWPDGNEDLFVVKSGSMYAFDTSGDWEGAHYRSIIAPSRVLEVPFCQEERESFPAPRGIMRAFDLIKSRPVLANK